MRLRGRGDRRAGRLLVLVRHRGRVSVARVVRVALADPQVLYLGRVNAGRLQLEHSRDAGAAWEVRLNESATSCGWTIPVLLAHEFDVAAVALSV